MLNNVLPFFMVHSVYLAYYIERRQAADRVEMVQTAMKNLLSAYCSKDIVNSGFDNVKIYILKKRETLPMTHVSRDT